MQDPISDLVQRGRDLAPEDRERLVDQLLESLNEPSNAELDAAWESEIERSVADLRAGRVETIDGEEVFAKARRLAK
jgi:putative addiction module component (TIGR02574 family)